MVGERNGLQLYCWMRFGKRISETFWGCLLCAKYDCIIILTIKILTKFHDIHY